MDFNPRTLVLVLASLATLAGCGSDSNKIVIDAGTGGASGTAGDGGGGESGAGGAAGASGSSGSSGTGGTAGSGGQSGTGGGGGFAGIGGACLTNALCHTCPSEALPSNLRCASDEDCSFPGYVCVPSGCTTESGQALGQCQEPPTGSCTSVAECPNATDYECGQVGAGGMRCLRVTAGCTAATESYDCAPGFACEGGTCVDRRVPCDSSFDCPTSHICTTTPTARFCVRIYRTCHRADADCAGLGPFCADIDGDGRKECAGELGETGEACVNSSCLGGTPVCENGNFGTGNVAVCGDYGICLDAGQCRSTFDCLAMGADGRKECVLKGARGCETSAECPLNQVCAVGRSGGTPECQIGTGPVFAD